MRLLVGLWFLNNLVQVPISPAQPTHTSSLISPVLSVLASGRKAGEGRGSESLLDKGRQALIPPALALSDVFCSLKRIRNASPSLPKAQGRSPLNGSTWLCRWATSLAGLFTEFPLSLSSFHSIISPFAHHCLLNQVTCAKHCTWPAAIPGWGTAILGQITHWDSCLRSKA